MLGRDGQDPLFLQLKEAESAVLEEFLQDSEFENHGERVVTGQRLMQASSDIFLGWLHVGGRARTVSPRLLWAPAEGLEGLGRSRTDGSERHGTYGQLCGWTLARAHARSGDRIAIAAYLGKSAAFDRAIVEFSHAYAEQNQRDYKALTEAVESGRITAETGL